MTFEQIRELITDIVSCSEDEVTMDTDLKEDLGMDSLDAMELAMVIEEKMGVKIPDEQLAELIKVSDIVDFVDKTNA